MRARYRVELLVAAFLFSTGGAAIKLCSLSSWQIASFRSGVAALCMAILIPEARRNWTWRTLAVGLAYAATLIAYVTANKLTTAANAIFLQSTAPLYLLFLGPLILRERVRRADVAVFLGIGGGVALLLYGSRGSHGGPGLAAGDLVGLFAGFCWACTIAGLRWLGKHDESGHAATATVVAGNLIAFVVCLPAALPVAHATPADAAAVLYLGVFQVALAYVFLTRSIRHVPGFEAATLLLVEPVFNPAWTWLLEGERPGPLVLAGGAVSYSLLSPPRSDLPHNVYRFFTNCAHETPRFATSCLTEVIHETAPGNGNRLRFDIQRFRAKQQCLRGNQPRREHGRRRAGGRP
jgi:drug/metabolite transporter (DMT)-like permease